MTLKRAKSMHEFFTTKFKTMKFTGEWLKAIGEPEQSGSWMIWGDSGNGKTRFVVQLIKYLATFTSCAYNSLEEGESYSLQTAFIETGIKRTTKNLVLLDKESIEHLMVRLDKHKSPNIIVIDSIQYTGMNYKEYKKLIARYPKKLFIFISHSDGKNPAGRVAKSIRFDANVKIRVEGYKAFPVSRYGGGQPYTIWEQGAADYWGLENTLN